MARQRLVELLHVDGQQLFQHRAQIAALNHYALVYPSTSFSSRRRS